MPMSAIFRRNDHPLSVRRSFGFTLLEMLVVLALAGLLAGIVLPRMAGALRSLELTNQRAEIIAAVENLGYQAYLGGKRRILGGDAEADVVSPLAMPPGWRIEAPAPIRYDLRGTCSGGVLVLIRPDRVRETYLLAPPDCRMQPISEQAYRDLQRERPHG